MLQTLYHTMSSLCNRFLKKSRKKAACFKRGGWACVFLHEGIAHAGGLLQLAFSFFCFGLVWICFLRLRSGLSPRAPAVSRDPGGALLCTFLFSKGSGGPVMISRACGSRFFPSDRYMTENVKSGNKNHPCPKLGSESQTAEIPDQVRDDDISGAPG